MTSRCAARTGPANRRLPEPVRSWWHDGWFLIEEFEHSVVRIAEPGHRHRVNSYLVHGERESALIDAGMGFGDLQGVVQSLTDRDPVVVLTHAHWDHVGSAHQFDRILVHPSEADDLRRGTSNRQLRRWFDERHLFGVELPEYLDAETHEIPPTEPSGFLVDGDRIDLGDREFLVLHTPGHSQGSVTLIDEQYRLMFTGDAIYRGPMLCNFSGTDPVAYRSTLRRLAEAAALVDVVYPGHLDAPIDPAELPAMAHFYERIWSGEVAPDDRRNGTDIFTADSFAFWLTRGAYGERVSQ